jgi:hypothetical protein
MRLWKDSSKETRANVMCRSRRRFKVKMCQFTTVFQKSSADG